MAEPRALRTLSDTPIKGAMQGGRLMKIEETPTRRRRRSLSDEVMCGGVSMSMENALDHAEQRKTSAERHGKLDRELTMSMLRSPVADGVVFPDRQAASGGGAGDQTATTVDVPLSPPLRKMSSDPPQRKVSSDLVAGRNLSMLSPLLSLDEEHFSPDKPARRCVDDDVSGVQYISPCRIDCEDDALRWSGMYKGGSGGSPDSVDEVAETTWWDTMRQIQVLSVHELERRIGFQGGAGLDCIRPAEAGRPNFRRSFGSFGSLAAMGFEDEEEIAQASPIPSRQVRTGANSHVRRRQRSTDYGRFSNGRSCGNRVGSDDRSESGDVSGSRTVSGDIPGGIEKYTIQRSTTSPHPFSTMENEDGQLRRRATIAGQAEEVSSEDELIERPRAQAPLRSASGYEAEAGLFSTGSAPDMIEPPSTTNSNTNADAIAGDHANGDAAQQRAEEVDEAVGLHEADQMVFDQVFDVHPFAAAAFLRAFVSCSTGLMFFHIHSLSVWPANVNEAGATATEAMATMAAEMEQHSWVHFAKVWVMLQVAVLVVGLPLRVEVQRELYGVSTARDTTEATRRLRVVFKSRCWKMNRMVGYVMMILGLIGPIFLGKAGYLWGNAHPESNGAPQGTLSNLPVVHQRLLSACSSNLLIFMMRVILTLSLLYFVQITQQARTGTAARRGLTDGTIKRLRRLVYSSELHGEGKGADVGLTSCAVCLGDYEDDDHLMILPCDPRHNFHAACIEPWLKRTNTCPLCQRGVPQS